MNITAAQVNELRQMTGAGMMDCKKALVECNGDKEAAIDFLRKKGQKIAEKRADREAAEGVVISATTADHTYGAVVMLNCETDFVGSNADFVGTAKSFLNAAIENKIKNLDELKAFTMNGRTVAELVTDLTAKTGEKTELKHLEVIEAPYVANYNHQGNRLATIVGFNKAFEGIEETAHEVAMHAAAMSPIAVDENDVPAETKTREYEVAVEKTKQEQAAKAVDVALKKAGINPAHVDSDAHIDSNMAKGWITEEQAKQAREIRAKVTEEALANVKPAMVENIAKGRVAKFFKENCLLDQASLLDGSMTVRQFIQKADKEATVTAFKRVQLG
ncbi:MAG: translation elongation factor Ts [Bacteroidia bacterium]|nr:translation elongation factor Ts [Bacteroidia bacterium]